MVNDGRYPKAVQDGIVVEEVTDDLLIFDSRVQRAHSLNPTAKAVWEASDGQHSPEQLADGLGLDRDAVMLALQSLSACDLLERPMSSDRVVSRREVLRGSRARGCCCGSGAGDPLGCRPDRRARRQRVHQHELSPRPVLQQLAGLLFRGPP